MFRAQALPGPNLPGLTRTRRLRYNEGTSLNPSPYDAFDRNP